MSQDASPLPADMEKDISTFKQFFDYANTQSGRVLAASDEQDIPDHVVEVMQDIQETAEEYLDKLRCYQEDLLPPLVALDPEGAKREFYENVIPEMVDVTQSITQAFMRAGGITPHQVPVIVKAAQGDADPFPQGMFPDTPPSPEPSPEDHSQQIREGTAYLLAAFFAGMVFNDMIRRILG